MEVITGETITTAKNYTTFICSAAACDFILPVIQPGLKYRFHQAADFQLQISPNGSETNIIAGHDATSIGGTWTTDGEQIGLIVDVESMYQLATLKWVMTIPTVLFSTDNFFAVTIDS